MSDNAKILAEMMGWEVGVNGWGQTTYQIADGKPTVYFDPENDDTDLMMCWDKLQEGFIKLSKDALREMMDEAIYWSFNLKGDDRRKAMVECMVKAVSS